MAGGPRNGRGAPSKGVPRFAGVPGAASGPKNGKGSRKAGKFWVPEKSGGSRFFPVFFTSYIFLDFSSISGFLQLLMFFVVVIQCIWERNNSCDFDVVDSFEKFRFFPDFSFLFLRLFYFS